MNSKWIQHPYKTNKEHNIFVSKKKKNFHIEAINCQLENPIDKNFWLFEDNLILAGVTNWHHVTCSNRLWYSLQTEKGKKTKKILTRFSCLTWLPSTVPLNIGQLLLIIR